VSLCLYVLCIVCVKEEGVDDANVSTMEVHTSVCVSVCLRVYVSVSMCLCSLCIVCVQEQGEEGVDDANVYTIEVHTCV